MRSKDGKRLYRLGDVLAVCVVLSIISAFISWNLFGFVGGFTAILGVIWLITIWDDIVVLWSTRGKRKKPTKSE